MKISILSHPFVNENNPLEGFKLLQNAGFDFVDFSFFTQLPYDEVVNGHTENFFSRPLRDVKDFYRPYAEAMKETGVFAHQCHAPFPSYTPNDAMNEAICTAIEKCMAVCVDMRCKFIVVHPYFSAYPQRMDGETRWRLNKEFYTRLIPCAKEYGVEICLENMFIEYRGRLYASACSDMDEAALYVDRLNDIAGFECFSFCYDT
nr:TIM barrel protein [Candidatus Limiplasma sp.]